MRNGFQDFLKRRAGKSRTVIILVAGHGTVDGKNAYILTYDSDPQDLKSTALPMAELQVAVRGSTEQGGQSPYVCRCVQGRNHRHHQEQHRQCQVENFKNVDGELLGMMSGSRRKELSSEGPEFGGGHGAFSYFVMKGMEGAADENGDGIVDGE